MQQLVVLPKCQPSRAYYNRHACVNGVSVDASAGAKGKLGGSVLISRRQCNTNTRYSLFGSCLLAQLLQLSEHASFNLITSLIEREVIVHDTTEVKLA